MKRKAEQKIKHQGWMRKQGGFRKNWKKRWFVLLSDEKHKKSLLRYYADLERTSLKGEVEIENASEVATDGETKLIVVLPTRTWQFECENREDREVWITHLTSLIPTAHLARQTPYPDEDPEYVEESSESEFGEYAEPGSSAANKAGEEPKSKRNPESSKAEIDLETSNNEDVSDFNEPEGKGPEDETAKSKDTESKVAAPGEKEAGEATDYEEPKAEEAVVDIYQADPEANEEKPEEPKGEVQEVTEFEEPAENVEKPAEAKMEEPKGAENAGAGVDNVEPVKPAEIVVVKEEEEVEEYEEKVEPAKEKVESAKEEVEPAIEKAEPAKEKVELVKEKVEPLKEKVEESVEEFEEPEPKRNPAQSMDLPEEKRQLGITNSQMTETSEYYPEFVQLSGLVKNPQLNTVYKKTGEKHLDQPIYHTAKKKDPDAYLFRQKDGFWAVSTEFRPRGAEWKGVAWATERRECPSGELVKWAEEGGTAEGTGKLEECDPPAPAAGCCTVS